MQTLSASLISTNKRYGIILGRFNEFIGSKLFEGCLDTLVRHGVTDDLIEKVWVPGAFEMPLIAQKMAQSQRFDAIICLGAVIRGATSHYDLVSGEVAKGLAQVSLQTGLPVIFGVLTTETIEQAVERAGTKSGNKGAEAALAAIEMVNLSNSLI